MPTGELLRELEEADVVKLGERAESVEAEDIKRLSNRHHALAKELAQGTPPGEAATLHDYTPSRVSVLQSSPAFKNLIQHYKKGLDRKYIDFHEVMSEVSLDAVSELRDRLENQPEDFTNRELTDLTKTLADRTGFGPTKHVTADVTVSMNDKLNKARIRARAAALGEIEDAQIVSEE